MKKRIALSLLMLASLQLLGCLRHSQLVAPAFVPAELPEVKLAGHKVEAAVRDHPEQEIEARGIHPVLDHVYYINLAESKDRRSWMEKWLRASNIPYERVEASAGPLMESPDKRCSGRKSAPKRCRGIIGLRDSNFYIMDHLNTSGSTLVLEDDHWVNFSLIPLSVAKVPADWDIIRFDCWGAREEWGDVFQIFRNEEGQVEIRSRGKTFFTEENWYCGGTHAMLWRGDAIPKLRTVWGVLPANGIDCCLSTDQLRSYCVRGPGSKTGTLTFRNKNFTTTFPKTDLSGKTDWERKRQLATKRIQAANRPTNQSTNQSANVPLVNQHSAYTNQLARISQPTNAVGQSAHRPTGQLTNP